MAYDVFISYSHKDERIVEALCDLLRISGKQVFRDAESIELGTIWREQIETALASADKVVVFWCCHADGSKEVSNEIAFAIERGKKLIPVLLCDRPVPPIAESYQWLDLRGIASHPCEHVHLTPIDSIDELAANDGELSETPSSFDRRRFGLPIAAGLVSMGIAFLHPIFNVWGRKFATIIGIAFCCAALVFVAVGYIAIAREWLSSRKRAKEGRVLRDMTWGDRLAVKKICDAILE